VVIGARQLMRRVYIDFLPVGAGFINALVVIPYSMAQFSSILVLKIIVLIHSKPNGSFCSGYLNEKNHPYRVSD